MLVWNEYTCTVSGATFKFVDCEKCAQTYVYQMVRDAQGQVLAGNSGCIVCLSCRRAMP